MINNQKLKFGIFLLIGILFIVSISAYSVSTTQYVSPTSSSNYLNSQGISLTQSFNRDSCQAGQDFIVQISPLGCKPTVVRSDLLEEQNVPVFCQLSATKINPLIEVEAIESISFRGDYPKEVSGVGFHPANAGIKTSQSTLLNSPILNNIGYAVVVLKKQPNESAMPDFVQGNMTARIKYDMKNAFGIGKATYYLPQISAEDWALNYKQYGFWKGKGFLKAENIESNGATISIYSGKDLSVSTSNKITSVSLTKGKTSGKINIPGFYCLASLQLRLDDLVVPDTRAKFEISGETVEVIKGEKFLDNKCSVRSVDKNGLYQKVSVYCSTDSGGRNFDFKIAPKVRLDFDETEKDYEIGERVFSGDDKKTYVYVGYVASKEISAGKVIDTTDKDNLKKNLIVYFYNSSIYLGEQLSDSLLSSIARSVEAKLRNSLELNIESNIKGIKYGAGKVFGNTINVIGFAGAQNEALGILEDISDLGIGNFINEETDYKRLPVNSKVEVPEVGEFIKVDTNKWEKDTGIIFTSLEMSEYTKVKIIFIATPNIKGDPKLLENYQKAIKTYDEIINSYSSVELSNDEKLGIITYGENASYEKIILAEKVGQKASAAGFCEKFKERYPASSYLKDVEKICTESALANSGSVSEDVLINGVVESIRFEGVFEPSQEEYSAEISVGNKDYTLVKNEILNLGKSSVQLISLDDDYADVRVSYLNEKGTSVSKTFKLKGNIVETFGSESTTNTIVLKKINLKKQAKVSVIPSIDNVGTDVNFTFNIGIEKRAIQLSPEKTAEKIKNLNETIEKWEGISKNLGNVVKGMKVACLGTSAFLTAKNFFSGFEGKAGARQTVTEGYRDTVCKGVKNMQKCLLDNNDNINADIEKLAEVNTNRDKLSDKLADGYVKGKDDEMVLKKDMMVNDKPILNNIGDSFTSKDGKVIITAEEMAKIKEGYLSSDNYRQKLRDIIYYEDMKSKKGIFEEEANKKLAELWGDAKEDYQLKNAHEGIADDYGVKSEDVTVRSEEYVEKVPISNPKVYTEFSKNLNLQSSKEEIKKGSYGRIAYREGNSNERYFVIFGKDGVIAKTYKIGDDKKTLTLTSSPNPLDLRFNIVDANSYKNKYDTPQIIYYGHGPYNGQPQIVPVDINEGFYAMTTEGRDTVGAYEGSAMPKFFYLCNVMGNNKQEAMGGDDECVSVKVSDPVTAELGELSLEDTKKWAGRAIRAMREASSKYKAGMQGTITVLGQEVGIGNPSFGAGTECEDFMSPEDCALLFNVCDPVICPESRCDLGGKYRVSNVIQSGIIGGILLCLPNFGSPSEGGVVIPVCLTGINAGIESLVSIYKNYGDCLQHSLDTGETVGVCDEIHSIYLCEFFWKQAVPFVKLTLPTVVEFLLTGGKGGGEYMNVQGAWDVAGKSVDYLTNYYGANSYAAFKVRATDEVGSAVCKNFVSARYPASGDFFDALIEPDSPSQYHGWFHETTFTTATVPPTSQYKVFYHIYAGKDVGVYYNVYLKNPIGSSFYADAPRINVASGYIERGGYASETKDMLEVSGYKEMCINVQGNEECGFKEVSTSFAMDYLQDQYVKDQAERTDIKSEKECISGSSSLYSMITPNVQAGAESVIDPQIYNQGIVRVCATNNPGGGTDMTRWVNVGTCGGNINCWLDKKSVADAVVFNESLKGLKEVTKNALEKLRETGNYLSAANFDKLIKEINELKNNNDKIKKINNNFDKVLLNKEKAQLLYLKVRAYVGLVWENIGDKGEESAAPTVEKKEDATTTDSPTGDNGEGEVEKKVDCKAKCKEEFDSSNLNLAETFVEGIACRENKGHSLKRTSGNECCCYVEVEESDEEINKNYKVSKISLYVEDKEVNSVNIPNNGDEISFRVRTGDNLYLSFEHNCYGLSLEDENEKLWYSSLHDNYFYSNYYGSKIDSEKKLILENNKGEKNLDNGKYKFKFTCIKNAQKQYLRKSYVFNLIVE